MSNGELKGEAGVKLIESKNRFGKRKIIIKQKKEKPEIINKSFIVNYG